MVKQDLLTSNVHCFVFSQDITSFFQSLSQRNDCAVITGVDEGGNFLLLKQNICDSQIHSFSRFQTIARRYHHFGAWDKVIYYGVCCSPWVTEHVDSNNPLSIHCSWRTRVQTKSLSWKFYLLQMVPRSWKPAFNTWTTGGKLIQAMDNR